MNHKTAIVTGGSRGIGKSAVLLLSQNGYNVVFSYLHSKEEANSLTESIRENGGEAAAFYADCKSSGDAAALSEFCLERYGRIDLLVNNAGMSVRRLLTDMTDLEIHELIDVNLLGAVYMSRAVTQRMVHQKSGAIINVSSIHGVSGASMETIYSASKAGLIGFTKSLAKELAPSGITVNCIAPGVIDTEMNDFLDVEEREALSADIPLARFGRAGEIAKSILFLATQCYITGQTLVVDGGLTI